MTELYEKKKETNKVWRTNNKAQYNEYQKNLMRGYRAKKKAAKILLELSNTDMSNKEIPDAEIGLV